MTNEKKQVKRALALQEAFRNLREYTKSPAFTIHQLQDTLDCLVKEFGAEACTEAIRSVLHE
jgi:hypothetical protein